MEHNQLELTRRHDAVEKICNEQQAYLREAFHELRNGIHIITGNSELLSKWTDSCHLSLSAIRLTRNIREASHNILHFLNAGMELAKMNGGYQRQPEALQMKPWLQQLISMHQHHADNRQLKVQCNIAESFPEFIQTDTLLLRQIVGNLLHNAINFSLSGSVIRIECYEGTEEWTMVFSNKSMAISKEKMKELFKPFHTLGHAESNTGLGLAITRKYVEMLEGSIKASCINDQFIIWLRLPLKIVTGPSAPPLIMKPSIPIPVIHSARKVLVIEDNPLSQRLICHFLQEVGLRHVTVASRATEAVRIAKRLKPDLIFMDVHLPDQGGLETLQSLKSMLKDTHVIVMSGDQHLFDNAPLLKAGASEYILKPFELQKVAGIVQKYLDFAA